ncbi:hypothetical protein U9M48_011415 [Paspalum notatum var. saurae]|uniref:F-box/LRR-repeat protein 15/At3g58940/PEG3-like LRR domain-containing protein n=1 Tax=Paspalum notatum var. saurae TaxID=547442 RepID=A0AAQ3SVA9_PASNO
MLPEPPFTQATSAEFELATIIKKQLLPFPNPSQSHRPPAAAPPFRHGDGDQRKRRRLEEDDECLDRISRLPDGVLGDIISLLPTKDGARTQVISSRWRPLSRSAPLNLDLHDRLGGKPIPISEIPRILSAHGAPVRRFSVPLYRLRQPGRDGSAVTYPALDDLQEIDLEFESRFPDEKSTLQPLPASVHRFSSTLRVASFAGCGFPDGNASTFHLPLLKQLTVSHVKISESSLHALLAGCPVLQSLLLSCNHGCSRLRIVSHTLRSIGVNSGYTTCRLQQLILEDTPCLERLLLFSDAYYIMDISVISAPKLNILGPLSNQLHRLDFGTVVFQSGITPYKLHGDGAQFVKVLTLVYGHLSLDAVINFVKCFPYLEKLYLETICPGEKNVWCRKYRNLVGTLDIHVKKIVLLNYPCNKSHVNFARFFVLNAQVLDSMIFEIQNGNMLSNGWIERQHVLLSTQSRASTGARFDFVYYDSRPGPLGYVRDDIAHDLSTADPFERFRDWLMQ